MGNHKSHFLFLIIFLMAVLIAAPAFAQSGAGAGLFLLIDEDTIDNGTSSIEAISFNAPHCGAGDPAVCVNDHLANPGVRTTLFNQGNDITPFDGLVLHTGQTGDEGLFRFHHADPQVSAQNGATFTLAEFVTASGAAADENNLDKIMGVTPLGSTDIEALVGQTVCAVVYDSDISVSVSDGYGNLKGATLGVTAFRVTDVMPNPNGGSYLPLMTVSLLPSSEVATTCQNLPQSDQPASSIIRWESIEDAECYQIQIDNDADFSSPLHDATVVQSTQYNVNLLPNGQYYWRVRDGGACANVTPGPWSQAVGFSLP